MGGAHPLFLPGAEHINSSLIPSDLFPAQDWPSLPPNHVIFQPQNNLRTNDLDHIQQQPLQSFARKRAPKAQTMSAKRWRPCEDRLRQLYVHEGKSIRNLREIVNEEFQITATERQYKAQIKKMNLKRNVSEEDQKAIARSIYHRTNALRKKSSYVRVRGHKISQEKMSRWIKDTVTYQSFTSAIPPSPLPSYISIYTNSPDVSPKHVSSVISEYEIQSLGSMSSKDLESSVIQRILKYARVPKQIVECKEARAMFNDLQLILSCLPETRTKQHGDVWYPSVGEDIIEVRNLMNMSQELIINESGVELQRFSPTLPDQTLETNRSRGRHRHAAWMTPHGRVEAVFWDVSKHSSVRVTDEHTADTSGRGFAAKVAIIPIDSKTDSIRVVFDFTPHLNLSANISYQAMIPNDSEVFIIAAYGQVEELIDALEKGTASLTDRDEQGRSLLNYAFRGAHPDMCKFLVDKKADVDAIEPAENIECIGPIHGLLDYNESEEDEKLRSKIAESFKIVLEAKADFSIETYLGDGIWINSFIYALSCGSFKAFKHVLDFGEPFISLNDTYNTKKYEKFTPLMVLAGDCGYHTFEIMDVVDKAILLLQRGADISCCYSNGNTVLHTLLECARCHEDVSKADASRIAGVLFERWNLSFTEPEDLLVVFISAGADVYATNNIGHTPTFLASVYDRDEEWIEALEVCGYDSEHVLAHSDTGLHDCSCERQTSKLTFQQYCLQRRERKAREENIQFEEIETDDEDGSSDEAEGEEEDDDESDVVKYLCARHRFKWAQFHSKETECRDEKPESYYGAEPTDHGMDLSLEDTGYSCGDDFTREANDHVAEPDDSWDVNFEGMDLDFGITSGNEKEAMGDFFDFSSYADAFL